MRNITLIAVLLCLCLGACKKNSDPDDLNPDTRGKATITMRLTDGPADYDHIYIDIQQVEVTMNGSAAVTVAPVRPGIYDILRLKNGLDTLLATATVPAGTVNQIRLILGPNNSIVVDGKTHALNTPSAQESGLKLNLNQTLAANGSYDIWLDFDAAKSIVQTGNGAYKLKPVIKAYSALTNGRIKGNVLPLSALATVYAVQGTDTVSAIPNANDGFFMFTGLSDGNYTIIVEPGVPGFKTHVQSSVWVTYGTEVNLGSITLVP